MIYDLPTSLEVCGVEYEIRSDYRAVLDICIALSDAELSDEERALVALAIFYPAYDGYEVDGKEVLMPPEHYRDAVSACYRFIDRDQGPEDGTPQPRLMDWEKDFQHIVSPVNRVLGTEIRAVKYMHWWTFLAAYMEIGDCLFSQIVGIRSKLARNQALDKSEREWYRRNRDLVDIETKYTEAEQNLLKQWGGV